MAYPNDVEVLFKKGKRAAAAFIHSECVNNLSNLHQHRMLSSICDALFDPRKPISDWDTIDWIRWIIAGGKNPEEFAQDVKRYDNATKCGLVWTANFVAYRCRTCGISPCMSLCADCFKKGDHEGHDFNMFRSQAGGACDCGDESVMKVQGFCAHHGNKVHSQIPPAPPDLLCVAKAIISRVIQRLIIHLRKSNADAIREADVYIKDLLHKMTEMGAAMRSVLSEALINPNLYSSLANDCDSKDLEVVELIRARIDNYTRAKKSMPNFRIPTDSEEYKVVLDNISFQKELVHNSFIEEFLFWTIIYEFPQKLVCFLLNMLPDTKYKEAFAMTFVHHYSRISVMLCHSRSSDRLRNKENAHDILSNCVVHVSVQLFSNEELAIKLCEKAQLLYVLVISLMTPIHGSNFEDDNLSGILMSDPMQDAKLNVHYVVRCDHQILKDHWYWPIVSDLNNLLTHRPVAMMFMDDLSLLDFWLELIMAFQGMNLNQREMSDHVEYENNAYYSAFSAELEICATPMWNLICHLKNSDTSNYAIKIVKQIIHWLDNWFKLICFDKESVPNPLQSTFHIPLHRYFSVFLYNAVNYQNIKLEEILPSEDCLKQILAHPLQTQIAFYEIIHGLWVRNGLQIKGQAMTYIQCHFCNSMVDADLFLIQQCATHINNDWFIQTVMERFHIWEWFSFVFEDTNSYKGFLEQDQILPMTEAALTFLATLFSTHTNLGMTEEQITRKEIVSLLAMGDKTHSQLMDLLPEKCGTQTSQNTYFESVLNLVSAFKSPNVEAGGSLIQGQFYPKPEVWENEYDPIHVLLRAVHRKDFQASMDRFFQFARQSGKFKGSSQPWPPFRNPPLVDTKKFIDTRVLLQSKVLHGVIFSLLYKAIFFIEIPDQILALTIYLLEMAIRTATFENIVQSTSKSDFSDLNFSDWFSSNSILDNFCQVIKNIKLPEQTSFEGAIEEMEVDEDFSATSGESDEYMSGDDDNQPYEVHSPNTSEVGESRSLESSVQRPQLPSVIVPLALPPATSSTSSEVSGALVPVSPVDRQIAPVEQVPQENLQQTVNPLPPLRLELPAPSTINENQQLTVAPLNRRLRVNQRLRSARLNDQRQLMDRMSIRELLQQPVQQSNELTHPQLVVTELMKALPPTSGQTLVVEESILSLLIRLHSKLSGKPDSYKPSTIINESRIGDGPYFICQLLNRFVSLHPNGENVINELRQKIWPIETLQEGSSSPGATDEMERELKKQRAKERQQKLMAEFASKQKAFLKNLEAEEAENSDLQEDAFPKSTVFQLKEYQCVICNQSGPSTNEKLFGQVVTLQSTSVLGHSYIGASQDHILPTSEEEMRKLNDMLTLAKFMEQRIDDFSTCFERNWLESFNIGWVGGVHVQSCGHYLHIDCHKSYMQSLRGAVQQNRYGIDNSEYLCPLCRQLANSVLPVNPSTGEIGALVKSRSNDLSAVAQELFSLLSNISHADSEYLRLLGSAIEDLTKTTGPQYRNIRTPPSQQSLFLFLCSILRTNLEVDLLIKRSHSVPCGAKKACFVPLFHVLAMNAKFVMQQINRDKTYDNLWSQLTGITLPNHNFSLSTIEKEVPLLLRDVSSLLIQVMCALPLNVDKAYFTTVVQTLYNLNVIQALAKLSCLIVEVQRREMKNFFVANGCNITSLPLLLSYVIDILEHSVLYSNLDDDKTNTRLCDEDLNIKVQSICLPFLRVASMLQHHLYSETYPNVEVESEFVTLTQFLGLYKTEEIEIGSAVHRLNWCCENPRILIETWCRDFMSFVAKSTIIARKLLRNPPIVWERPSLLRLPSVYDQLFMCYHQRECNVCSKMPKDPSICLVCGTLVCMRESCCRKENGLEAVHHSETCGAGTALYLVCNSSTIIVIRGKRACVWGSVYLDCYGEEDRDLKRGKPLYLSEQRYWTLEQQWLTHSFDHANKRWVYHKDTL